MHASSFENMEKCYRKYLSARVSTANSPLKVLDVGGANINGGYADIFSGSGFDYIGADIQPGEGVSVVLDDPDRLPFDDNSIDVVISGQMLEHCEYFWVTFSEMVRVLKESGYIFLIAPSAGPIHNYPVDCYRFYPDAYKALASYAGCHVIDIWHDNRGPWKDLVGVFNKTGTRPLTLNSYLDERSNTINSFSAVEQSSAEKTQGVTDYLEVLTQLHRTLAVACYLEIGVRLGRSLAVANGRAIGIDPNPDIQVALPESTSIIKKTSDDFFEVDAGTVLAQSPDLVFIDGMHWFEYALRDFMNVESHSNENTVVVIDDIFPNHPRQASRNRETRVWTGDVWKLYVCLKKHRPDLCIIPIDTSPTGLLIITGLDRNSRVLWDGYNPIVREIKGLAAIPPDEILGRKDAVSPLSNEFSALLTLMKSATEGGNSLAGYRQALLSAVYPEPRRAADLKLSVIVICFNMVRELPRTLKTLSPAMQRGLEVSDYEIIVVDNASSEPVDQDYCRSLSPNIRFMNSIANSVSPAQAINEGIATARSDFVGVMIDGARMVSPGILRAALDAAGNDPYSVVGTLAFHLGHAVQMESVKNGYDQEVEDKLLASVPWQTGMVVS